MDRVMSLQIINEEREPERARPRTEFACRMRQRMQEASQNADRRNITLSRQERWDQLEEENCDLTTIVADKTDRLNMLLNRNAPFYRTHQKLQAQNVAYDKKISDLENAIQSKEATVRELAKYVKKKYDDLKDFPSQGAMLDQILDRVRHQYAIITERFDVLNKWYSEINRELLYGTDTIKDFLTKIRATLQNTAVTEDSLTANWENEQIIVAHLKKHIDNLEKALLPNNEQECDEFQVEITHLEKKLREAELRRTLAAQKLNCIERKKEMIQAHKAVRHAVRMSSLQIEGLLEALSQHEQRYHNFSAAMEKELASTAHPQWWKDPRYTQPQTDQRMLRPLVRPRTASAEEYDMPHLRLRGPGCIPRRR